MIFATNNDDPIKRPELAAAAVEVLRARGVPADLHVLRGVPYPDVPVWLNASDAVLVTSRSEGSPTIVKEALACNRPVVSVAVGDVSDQIAGIAGCFVCGDGASELADKLQRVSEGPRVVSGREHMVRYSIESTAKRLCEFYEETLESWRGSAAVPAPEPLTRLRRTS